HGSARPHWCAGATDITAIKGGSVTTATCKALTTFTQTATSSGCRGTKHGSISSPIIAGARICRTPRSETDGYDYRASEPCEFLTIRLNWRKPEFDCLDFKRMQVELHSVRFNLQIAPRVFQQVGFLCCGCGSVQFDFRA